MYDKFYGFLTYVDAQARLWLQDKVDKVVGVDNVVVRFDGITGAVQNSTATIDDTGRFNTLCSGGGAANLGADVGILSVASSTGTEIEMGITTAAPWGGWIQCKNTTNNGASYPLGLQTVGGNVGIGTDDPLTKLEVNGYTKHGSDAPAIKTKKLTGTTSSTGGTTTYIAHGLDVSKIISIVATVRDGVWLVAPALDYYDSYYFNWMCDNNSIHIKTKSSGSGAILDKLVIVYVTYEE